MKQFIHSSHTVQCLTYNSFVIFKNTHAHQKYTSKWVAQQKNVHSFCHTFNTLLFSMLHTAPSRAAIAYSPISTSLSIKFLHLMLKLFGMGCWESSVKCKWYKSETECYSVSLRCGSPGHCYGNRVMLAETHLNISKTETHNSLFANSSIRQNLDNH